MKLTLDIFKLQIIRKKSGKNNLFRGGNSLLNFFKGGNCKNSLGNPVLVPKKNKFLFKCFIFCKLIEGSKNKLKKK